MWKPAVRTLMQGTDGGGKHGAGGQGEGSAPSPPSAGGACRSSDSTWASWHTREVLAEGSAIGGKACVQSVLSSPQTLFSGSHP